MPPTPPSRRNPAQRGAEGGNLIAGLANINLASLQKKEKRSSEDEVESLGELGKLVIDGQTYRWNKDDFETLDQLGGGGFGVVLKVLHKPSSRLMAAKYVRNDTGKLASKKYLRDEVKLARSINCPYIVNCFGTNIWEGDVQVYMELLTMSLDKLITKVADAGKHIPEHIIARIAFCAVSGLDHLKEEHNAMHRDIKPSNILMGSNGLFKLCDFGLSTVMTDSILYSHVGSEMYIAPERLAMPTAKKTQRPYDIRADVWSLGVTLVELGMLRFPYAVEAGQMFQLFRAVTSDPPPQMPERYSQNCRGFVDACLRKDPKDRPKYRRRERSKSWSRAASDADGASSSNTSSLTSSQCTDGEEEEPVPLMELPFFGAGEASVDVDAWIKTL